MEKRLSLWCSVTVRFCLLFGLVLVGVVSATSMTHHAKTTHAATVISRFAQNAAGKKYIEVDGSPFLPLTVQYRADQRIDNFTNADSYFADAKAIGFNTVSTQLWWGWIEPSQGTWDWTTVDNFIDTAYQNGLRLDLLWFGIDISGGAITNASSQNYPHWFPSWIASDTSTYQRHINSNGQISEEKPGDGGTYDSFSFTNQDTLNQEKTALQALMNHIASYDTHHTVIGVQLNNETLINARVCDTSNENDRSYDAATTTAFQSSGISNSQQFARNQLADWQNALGQVVKQSNYPVYTRMNYWGQGCGSTAAEIKSRSPNVDFIGNDPYSSDIGTVRYQITNNLQYNGYSIAENEPYSDTPTLMLTSYDAGGFYYSIYTLVQGDTGNNGLVNSDHSWTANTGAISSALKQLGKDQQDLVTHVPNSTIGYFHVLDTNSSDNESKTLSGVNVNYNTSNGGMGVAIMNSNDLLLMGVNGTGNFTVSNGLPDSVDQGYFDANHNWVSTGSASYTNNGNGTFSVTTGSTDFIRLHYNNGIGSVGTTTIVDDSIQGSGVNQFNYSGSGWGHCTNCDTDHIGRYNGSNSWDSTAGDSLTFQFNGTGVVFYAIKTNNSGYADFSIDGGAATTVDFYSPTAAGNQPVFVANNLSNGSHTLKMVVDGRGDAGTSPYYIVADRIDVTTGNWTLIDDSVQGSGTNQFNYSGSGWGHCTNCDTDHIGRYNGSNSWDTTAGDSLTFQFNGTGVAFYAIKTNNSGYADFSIDGGAVTTIDLNSLTAAGNQVAFVADNLANGSHTLKVVVDGRGDAGASPYYVVADRIDVVQ